MPETYAALLREVASRVAIEREMYGSQAFDEAAPAQLRTLADQLERVTPEAVRHIGGMMPPDLLSAIRALAAGPQGES